MINPKATKFGEITQSMAIMPFKVTDLGTLGSKAHMLLPIGD